MASSEPIQHSRPRSPDRSPSPAAQPPVAQAPGPRATALTRLHAEATAHILKTCSYTNFAACFPTPAKHVPTSFRTLHAEFVEKLGEGMRREFDTIVEERGVVGRLNELDGLVGEARRRREIEGQEGNGGAGGRERRAMHTLPAKELCSAHLLPSLTSHSAELSTRQETLQNENVDILSRVMEQRKQIEAMVRGLENVIADLDASVETLQEAGIDGLREEVRGVDEDVRTTG